MANPFKDLQARREAEEAERRRQEEANRKVEQEKEQKRQAKIKQVEFYDKMVRSVLQQLVEAAYPHLYIGVPENTNKDEGKWSIGYTPERAGYDGPDPMRIDLVTVELKFDNNGMPIRFDCWLEGKNTHSKLTESDLINALRQLHGV